MTTQSKTVSEARRILGSRIAIRVVCGEYRVAPSVMELKRLFRQYDHKAACERSESLASYATDLESAVAEGQAHLRWIREEEAAQSRVYQFLSSSSAPSYGVGPDYD